MAYVGLRKPYVAQYNRSTRTYSNGFKYSHAVSLTITPAYAEGSLYGDDEQVEYEKKLTQAAISLGTTSTPIQAASVVFGHTVDLTTNQVTYKSTDEQNYVGVGVVAPEKVDGESKYVALIVTCAKFSDSADNFTTKADSLTFNTPTIEGAAIANEDGIWKVTKVFDNEADAIAFVKSYLNIPTTTYSVTQTLSHVTSSFSGSTVNENSSLSATLTAESGYEISSVSVTMGGTDITSSAYNSSTGAVSIASVTGAVVITATGTTE